MLFCGDCERKDCPNCDGCKHDEGIDKLSEICQRCISKITPICLFEPIEENKGEA